MESDQNEMKNEITNLKHKIQLDYEIISKQTNLIIITISNHDYR